MTLKRAEMIQAIKRDYPNLPDYLINMTLNMHEKNPDWFRDDKKNADKMKKKGKTSQPKKKLKRSMSEVLKLSNHCLMRNIRIHQTNKIMNRNFMIRYRKITHHFLILGFLLQKVLHKRKKINFMIRYEKMKILSW